MLQLIGTSCLCYNNTCITKLLSPDLTFSIYTWFSWHCFHTFLYNSFQRSFKYSKLNFIIIHSYEHLKRIEFNTKLNQFESLRTHCSSESSVSYHASCTSVLLMFKSYHTTALRDNFPRFSCWEDLILREFQDQFCACSARPGQECESLSLLNIEMPTAFSVGHWILVKILTIKSILIWLITSIL